MPSGLIIYFFHHLAELIQANTVLILWLNFRDHILHICQLHQPSLPLERFLQVLCCDEP